MKNQPLAGAHRRSAQQETPMEGAVREKAPVGLRVTLWLGGVSIMVLVGCNDSLAPHIIIPAAEVGSEKTILAKGKLSKMVHITGRLESFTPNAMTDTYEDGAVSFDATKLRVISPPEFSEREVTIYHSNGVPSDSLWRAVGKTIVFTIGEDSLKGNEVIFDGAVTDMRSASEPIP